MIKNLHKLAWLIMTVGPFLALSSRAADFNFEDLTNLIQTNKPAQLGDLLKALPEEIRSSFTLMQDSKSAQSASPQFPRVIMYSPNGKLVMTFNGSPDQINYSRLEVIQFRDDEKKFEFRSIKFADTIEISPPNPKSCLGCHGENPHPIWANYNNWPGAYGENDDYLLGKEYSNYLSWKDLAQTHDRYSALVFRDKLSDNFPYRLRYFGDAGFEAHIIRPNDRFGNLVVRLNAQRVFRQIQRTQAFDKIPYSLLAVLLNCEGEGHDAYVARVAALFEKSFPQEKYPLLYQQLKEYSLTFEPTFFRMERLATSVEYSHWNLSLRNAAEGAPNNASLPGTDQNSIKAWVAARVLEELAKADPFAKEMTELWSYGKTFDLAEYEGSMRILEPGGVLAAYDSNGLSLNLPKAKSYCPQVIQKSLVELASALQTVPSQKRNKEFQKK